MITYFVAAPSDLSALAIVRRLRWDVLALKRQDTYYEARLRRITDQLEYAVRAWPGGHWPVVSSEDKLVPCRKKVLALLSPTAPAAACQSQLLGLIRLLL